MALKKCPDCGGDVSTQASVCPHCGRALESNHKWFWLVFRIVFFLAFMAVLYHFVLQKSGLLSPSGHLRF